MPDQKEYYDLLYAYTLGCLDSEELEQLKEYMDTGENFPWQELGEFQNLSSLLPSIISIESPAQEVKDKVARKLYRIRQEIKAKRDARKSVQKKNDELRPVEQKQAKIIEEPLVEEEIEQDLKDKFKPDVKEFEIVSPKPVTSDHPSLDKEEKKSAEIETAEVIEPVIKPDDEMLLDFSEGPEKAGEDEIDTTSMTEEDVISASKTAEEIEAEKEAEEKRLKKRRRYSSSLESEMVKKKSGLPIVLSFIVLLAIVVIFIFLYLQASSNVNKYESQISNLNQEIATLSNQFKENKDLQTILMSKNLLTLELEGTKAVPTAFGKIFISSDLNRAYVQLTNLNTLSGNGVYQLWINFSGRYLSLLKFNTTGNTSYFPFEAPQINAKTKASFIVTSEPEGGSEQPGKNVFLEGRIK